MQTHLRLKDMRIEIVSIHSEDTTQVNYGRHIAENDGKRMEETRKLPHQSGNRKATGFRANEIIHLSSLDLIKSPS